MSMKRKHYIPSEKKKKNIYIFFFASRLAQANQKKKNNKTSWVREIQSLRYRTKRDG